MKKYRLILVIASVMLLSCDNWLELKPENDLIREEFWKTKEEVESVLTSGYVKLASNTDKLFYWGELRGGCLIEGESPVDAHLKIFNLEISETNDLARWGFLYSAINTSNEVIKYAPEVIAKDPSLSEPKMKGLQSEAYFQRALSYFYLVRVFGDVPYVTEPSDDDGKNYYIPKVDGMGILEKEVAALASIVDFAPETFSKVTYSKGRSTKGAIYALMADIYLWLEKPENAIDACEKLYALNRYTLVDKALWFDIFKEGNSNEAIFELKYNRVLGTSNPIVAPLHFNQGKRLAANEQFVLEFDETDDIRSVGASYLLNGLRYEIWKYIGISNDSSNPTLVNQRRSVGVNDDNAFMVYRYADVMLMEAEAQAMSGGYDRARALLAEVSQRAVSNTGTIDLPDDESAILRAILTERKKEFAFEGKRWFDILRITKRNYFSNKDILKDVVFSSVGTLDQARAEAVLRDNNSCYMPVHKDELESNASLEQNSFYKY